MSDVRVLIVDDQSVYRSALRGMLEIVGGYRVVAEAESGEDAVLRATETGPEVVLMDLRLPGMDGAAATELIRTAADPPEVVLMSTDPDALSPATVTGCGARAAVAKERLDPTWLERLHDELRPGQQA